MDFKVSSNFNVGDHVYINLSEFHAVATIKEIRFEYDGNDIETIYVTNDGNFTEDKLILAEEHSNDDIRTIHDIKNGMEFYWLNSRGEINVRTYWFDDSLSKDLIVNGNAFKSYDEALEALIFRQIHSQLINEARGFDIDQGGIGYYLDYYPENKSVFVDCDTYRVFPGVVYFDSAEAAEKAIDAVGGESYLIENYFLAKW